MTLSSKANRDIATVLWVVVGALIGVLIAWQTTSSARHMLFFVILGGGLVLLARVHIRVSKQGFTARSLPSPPVKALPLHAGTELSVSASADAATQLEASDEPLSEHEARQVLDDFLVQQQKVTKK